VTRCCFGRGDRDTVAVTQGSSVRKLHQPTREQIVCEQAQRRCQARRRADVSVPRRTLQRGHGFAMALLKRRRRIVSAFHRLALFEWAKGLGQLNELVARQPCFGDGVGDVRE
jgi:hypothetical protein